MSASFAIGESPLRANPTFVGSSPGWWPVVRCPFVPRSGSQPTGSAPGFVSRPNIRHPPGAVGPECRTCVRFSSAGHARACHLCHTPNDRSSAPAARLSARRQPPTTPGCGPYLAPPTLPLTRRMHGGPSIRNGSVMPSVPESAVLLRGVIARVYEPREGDRYPRRKVLVNTADGSTSIGITDDVLKANHLVLEPGTEVEWNVRYGLYRNDQGQTYLSVRFVSVERDVIRAV